MSKKKKGGGVNSYQSYLAQRQRQIYCRNQTTEQHQKEDRAIRSYNQRMHCLTSLTEKLQITVFYY